MKKCSVSQEFVISWVRYIKVRLYNFWFLSYCTPVECAWDNEGDDGLLPIEGDFIDDDNVVCNIRSAISNGPSLWSQNSSVVCSIKEDF